MAPPASIFGCARRIVLEVRRRRALRRVATGAGTMPRHGKKAGGAAAAATAGSPSAA
jgi:hypothetical protein